MKIKNVLLTLGLALGLGVSAVAGLSATQDVKAADAATIPAATKFYLTPSANWNQSNARFAVYFFGNGEAWASMTKVAGETNLYEVTSPNKTYENLIFCRMNPGAAANNWNNKWNQTADLTYNGTNNWYTVKEGTWDNGGGTWGIYAPGEEVTTYEVEEYTVIDGEIQGEPTIHKVTDQNYTPEMASTEELTVIGIYTDLEKTKSYSGTLVEGEVNKLYLHYEKITDLTYIYVSTFDAVKWGSEPQTLSVYSWDVSGTPTYGGWPGKTFNVGDLVASGTNFSGKGLLKVPFSAATKAANVIISAGEGKQTVDMTFVAGGYYDINVNFKEGNAKYTASEATVGAQAAVAWSIADAISNSGAHNYNGTDYEHSLCGIDSKTVEALLASYDALTDTVLIDATTYWTNNVNAREDGNGDVQESANYYGYEVIAQLRTLAGGQGAGSNLLIKVGVNNTSSTIILIVTAAVAVSAVAIYFVIRRKKAAK